MASTKTSAGKTKRATKTVKGKKQSPKKNKNIFVAIRARVDTYLDRRPHRSFRRTRRRDYKRSLAIPGYWSLTASVVRLLKQNKKTFLLLALLYATANILIMGMASQDNFTELQENVTAAGQEIYEGDWTALGTAALLTVSTISGNISPNLSEVQQIYAVILGLLVWLTTVWLLRQRMAGHTVRLRDGLYSAGAPIIATVVVTLVIIAQLLPVALAAIGFAAAQTTGLLSGGVEAMLFWAVAAALTTLSIYWISASAVAMVVVTLPGMYPFRALKIAGDMVVGRRLRIIYRLAWMVLLLAVFWVVIILPVILLDIGLKNVLPAIQWLPVVPFFIVLLTTISLIWMASYIYVLYRKIVEDDTKPA